MKCKLYGILYLLPIDELPHKKERSVCTRHGGCANYSSLADKHVGTLLRMLTNPSMTVYAYKCFYITRIYIKWRGCTFLVHLQCYHLADEDFFLLRKLFIAHDKISQTKAVWQHFSVSCLCKRDLLFFIVMSSMLIKAMPAWYKATSVILYPSRQIVLWWFLF